MSATLHVHPMAGHAPVCTPCNCIVGCIWCRLPDLYYSLDLVFNRLLISLVMLMYIALATQIEILYAVAIVFNFHSQQYKNLISTSKWILQYLNLQWMVCYISTLRPMKSASTFAIVYYGAAIWFESMIVLATSFSKAMSLFSLIVMEYCCSLKITALWSCQLCQPSSWPVQKYLEEYTGSICCTMITVILKQIYSHCQIALIVKLLVLSLFRQSERLVVTTSLFIITIGRICTYANS